MTKELSGAYNEWKFLRSNTTALVETFDEATLNTTLLRPGLDTYKKHILEMLNVQDCYSEAILSKEMSFAGVKNDDEFDISISKEQLLEKIKVTDQIMKERLENAPQDILIKHEGELKTLASHVCQLNSHESFHLGQLVAFCYAQNIEIPEVIVASWALTEQENA